jgi:hypothetical protein
MKKQDQFLPFITPILVLVPLASIVYLFPLSLEASAVSQQIEDDYQIFLPLVGKNTWPSLCYAPGTENFQAPAPVIPEIILQQGATITVTTNADIINGNVSSVAGLMVDPGPDGIALREAIEATNNDPGEYTIRFSAQLDGAIIYTGGTNNQDLPPLLGGSVIINGDIDGDLTPDVTIANGRTNYPYAKAFTIQSSNNTLYALRLMGYYQAVLIKPTTTNTMYSSIHISNLVISDSETGILLAAGECCFTAQPTHNNWEDIIILSNNIDVSSYGIALHLNNTIGDHLGDVMVAGNNVRVTQDIYADTNGVGIHFMVGFWDGSDGNTITNITLYQNTIQGNSRSSIAFMSGAVGASENTIDEVLVYKNQILISAADWARQAGRLGINFITGDGATDHLDPGYPLASPENNVIRNVDIIENTIDGFVDSGISIHGADGTGASYNSIENIRILRNNLTTTVTNTDYHATEIRILGGSGKPGYPSIQNGVSNVIVQWNTLYHSAQEDLPFVGISNGSISVVAGVQGITAEQQYVHGIWIAMNEIDSIIPNINLTGGTPATSSVIDPATIYCNTIKRPPAYPAWIPPVKGIVLVGGIFDSAFNWVNATLYNNNVAGVANDLTAIPNADEASYGNVVDYQIIP